MKDGELLSPGGRGGRPLGRDAECDRFDELLASARSGTSGVIVLRGGPGVGKSTVLQHAVGRANDMRIQPWNLVYLVGLTVYIAIRAVFGGRSAFSNFDFRFSIGKTGHSGEA